MAAAACLAIGRANRDIVTIELVDVPASDDCESWVPDCSLAEFIPTSPPRFRAPAFPAHKCALLVERNSRRIRLAGAGSEDFSIVATVQSQRGNDRDVTTADVIVLDRSRREGGAWPPEILAVGDVVTMQLIAADQDDEYEIHIPSEYVSTSLAQSD